MEADAVEYATAGKQAGRAKPYGWIGLPVSFVAIVIAGVVLCAAILGLIFAGAGLVLGWHEALVRVDNAKEALTGDPRDAETGLLILGLLIYLTLAAAVFAAARLRGGALWRDLIGWHPWTVARTPRVCWGIVAATVVYSFTADAALAYFYPASQNWITPPSSLPATIVFFILATVSAPMTEELLFRGWLFTGLRAKLSLAPSLVITSALFALAHWESTHLYALVVFPVGLALGFIRERTGSLKASMSFHAFYNGMAFLLMLAAS